MSEKNYNVSAVYSLEQIGQGLNFAQVSYETVQLMMKSTFVTIDNVTINTCSVEVADDNTVIFYGNEVDPKETINEK